MTFAFPYALWALLLLPLLAWWKGKRGQQAAFLYSSVQLCTRVSQSARTTAGRMLPAMRWFSLALLIVAFARPQQIHTEANIKASGVDIVVAIDLSSSMEAEDFQLDHHSVNRLAMAKDVLRKFIDRRPNDRIGLVAFAGRAYIAAPLTLDHSFLLQNLDRLKLRMIEDGTAIGSALSASLNRLRDLKSKSKIVILMTDGQNNAGTIPPLTAAEAAQALGVKVYTIGVGTRGQAPVPYVNLFGQRDYRYVQVDIDEDTLQDIANKTHGKYYRADNSETLRRIYDEIDQLEKTEVRVKKYERRQELFPWVLIPALGLMLLEILLSNTVWRKLP